MTETTANDIDGLTFEAALAQLDSLIEKLEEWGVLHARIAPIDIARPGKLSAKARLNAPAHSAPNSIGSARLKAISGMMPVSLISTATSTRPK